MPQNSARVSSPEYKLVALALLEHLGLEALVVAPAAPPAAAGKKTPWYRGMYMYLCSARTHGTYIDTTTYTYTQE